MMQTFVFTITIHKENELECINDIEDYLRISQLDWMVDKGEVKE